MISLRLMEDTMEDYIAMRNWFLEPELQEWVWCDEKGEPPVPIERIIEKYGSRVKNPTDVFSILFYGITSRLVLSSITYTTKRRLV